MTMAPVAGGRISPKFLRAKSLTLPLASCGFGR
jgi:hypothetical protein